MCSARVRSGPGPDMYHLRGEQGLHAAGQLLLVQPEGLACLWLAGEHQPLRTHRHHAVHERVWI